MGGLPGPSLEATQGAASAIACPAAAFFRRGDGRRAALLAFGSERRLGTTSSIPRAKGPGPKEKEASRSHPHFLHFRPEASGRPVDLLEELGNVVQNSKNGPAPSVLLEAVRVRVSGRTRLLDDEAGTSNSKLRKRPLKLSLPQLALSRLEERPLPPARGREHREAASREQSREQRAETASGGRG